MARKPRVEFSGALYHITARGNQRTDVFNSDADREYFLELLRRIASRLGWRIHAYCLMGNHYHLLVETPGPNLGKGMQALGTTYTQAFNRRNRKIGHLFQGRYKALIVEKESHLLEVSRYIVNNPVTASFVEHPWEWPWSSYRATAGMAPAPAWLETAWTLERFHPTDSKKAVAKYRQFADNQSSGDPFAELHLGLILGSEQFAAEMKPMVEASLSKDRSARTLAAQRPLGELFAGCAGRGERNASILLAYDSEGYTLAEIAGFLGLHEGSISRIIRREREKC